MTLKNKIIMKWYAAVAWLRFWALNIALAIVILSLILFLGTVNYFYVTSPQNLIIKQQQADYIHHKNTGRLK